MHGELVAALRVGLPVAVRDNFLGNAHGEGREVVVEKGGIAWWDGWDEKKIRILWTPAPKAQHRDTTATHPAQPTRTGENTGPHLHTVAKSGISTLGTPTTLTP